MMTISRSEAWDWVCKANEIHGLMQKLPDPRITWKTDNPKYMTLAWLMDCRRPELGHMFMGVCLTNYEGAVEVLEKEIGWYRLAKG